MTNIKNILLGSFPPTVKFWLYQHAILVLNLWIMPFLLAAWSFYFFFDDIKGVSINSNLFPAFVLIPIFGSLIHTIASFRSAKFTKSRNGKIICRIYAIAFGLSSIWLICSSLSLSIMWKENAELHAKAKIVLNEIYLEQMAIFANHGQYGHSDLPISLEKIDEIRSSYRFAVMVCKDSIKIEPTLVLNESPKHYPMDPDLMTFLKKWIQNESCEGRKNGFTAFAAARSYEDIGQIDGWQIDENYELRHLQDSHNFTSHRD